MKEAHEEELKEKKEPPPQNRTIFHMNDSKGKYPPIVSLKASIHCNREIPSLIPFKDLKIACSTKQVIEVADAFCHLSVISLSQTDI